MSPPRGWDFQATSRTSWLKKTRQEERDWRGGEGAMKMLRALEEGAERGSESQSSGKSRR